MLQTKGMIKTSKVAIAVAGNSSVLASMAGFKLPITSVALQACVSEPLKPIFDIALLSPATGVYISQSDKGELVMGGGLDMYPSYAQRGNIKTLEHVIAGVLELFPNFSRVKLMRQWRALWTWSMIHPQSLALHLLKEFTLTVDLEQGVLRRSLLGDGRWLILWPMMRLIN